MKKMTSQTIMILVVMAVILIFLSLGVIASLNSVILHSNPWKPSDKSVIQLGIFSIGAILTGIFMIQLYALRLYVFKSIHVVFGYYALMLTIGFISSLDKFLGSLAVLSYVPSLLFLIILWVSSYSHLKKAKNNKLMNFS